MSKKALTWKSFRKWEFPMGKKSLMTKLIDGSKPSTCMRPCLRTKVFAKNFHFNNLQLCNLLDNWGKGWWRTLGTKNLWYSVDIRSNCYNNGVILSWNISNKDIFWSWRFSWALARCWSYTVVHQCYRVSVIICEESCKITCFSFA